MTRTSQIIKKRTKMARQKSLYTMILLINIRAVGMLRKWYIMIQETALFSRMKSRIKIFIITAITSKKVNFVMLNAFVASLAVQYHNISTVIFIQL